MEDKGWGGGRNVTQEKRKVPGSYQAKRATTDNPRDGSRKINGMNVTVGFAHVEHYLKERRKNSKG